MSTDYRDLITRMAKELDDYCQLLLDDRTVTHRLSNEARAVLARWGNPTPQPSADGEVVEVVEWLHTVVAAYKSCHNTDHIWSLSGNGVNARLTVTLLTRAAELLQRQVLPEVGE